MRAAVLHGKEDVRIENVLEPALNPGEVRVSIQAALTCGTDLKVFKRGYHERMLKPPTVFGHEFAGIIAEVHPATHGWRIGDRVVAANSAACGECFYCHHAQENLCDDLLFLNGAYAESIVLPARIVEKNLLRLEESTKFCDAALTEPLACVVQGVADLALQGHERVLIIGSGPIGLMFVALARHLGCSVALAGRGETRLKCAATLGAASIEILPTDNLVEKIRASGRTFDIVIEATGKPEVWETAVQVVRKGGRVNFFGGCPAGTVVRFDPGLLHYSSLKLLASFHHTPNTIREALRLIEQGIITSDHFVTASCELDDLPKHLGAMAAGNRAIKTLVRTRRSVAETV